MIKKFLELNKQYDNKEEFKVAVQIDTKLIQSGVLKGMRPIEFMVLVVIASHMDETGECFPSMDYIAELIGSTKATVLRAIKGLLQFKYDGVPIITRVVEGSGVRKKSKYTFAIDTDNITEITEEDLQDIELNANSAVSLFAQEFKKEFGFEYRVSWKVEMAQMKKLLDLYGEEKLRAIIDITIHHYRKRWDNPAYPTPSIGAMFKWIYKEALKIHSDREAKQTQIEKYAEYEMPEGFTF